MWNNRRTTSPDRGTPWWAAYCLGVILLWGVEMSSSAAAATTPLLSRHVPSVISHLTPLGRLAATNELRLSIGLPLRNPEGLTNLLVQLYDPASTNYHHFLKPEDFAARFGPTEADYEAVADYSTAHGLHVVQRHDNRLVIEVSGPVAKVESALHTRLRTYAHPREARTFFAPDNEPTLDLAVPVLHIAGLDNYQLPQAQNHPVPLQAQDQISSASASGSGPGGSLLGGDFRTAYASGVTLTGAGQRLALVQFNSGFYAADLAAYAAAGGISNVPVSTVLLDGYNGGPGLDNGEVSLDLEMAMAMAPGLAGITVYEGSNPDDILAQIATDDTAAQISASWIYPVDATTLQLYQQFAAQGQSFFNSSGDSGAYAGVVSSPCDVPYITVVGGTTLTLTNSGSAWGGETAWNRGNGIATGGGISTAYGLPSWQANVNFTANGGSSAWRNLPDVAMVADNVWVCYGNGNAGSFGGTSCATPLWAAFTALINQAATSAGRPTMGFLNPALYSLGTNSEYALNFHDIITGNNTNAASPNAFPAVTGYDLCTGWGSPNGQPLIDALAQPGPLAIMTPNGFNAVGPTNGPFTPASATLTLTNWEPPAVHWSLINTAAWLTVSPTSGVLSPRKATSLQVALTSAAKSLPVGNYSATLTVTDLDDEISLTRSYSLAVMRPPSIVSGLTNITGNYGAPCTLQVTAAGSSPLTYYWQFQQISSVTLTNTGSSLTLPALNFSNMGAYSVVVSNAVGTASSGPVYVYATKTPPLIYDSPASQVVSVGQTAQFSVSVYGIPPLWYFWQHAGTNLPAATNATLTLSNVTLASVGSYAVIVTNRYGSAISSAASLTVLTNPPCDAVPAGIVSWWPGEGSPLDVTGTNQGITGPALTYGASEVGQGFFINATNAYLRIPASPTLNVGVGGSFTLEAWIDPTNVNGLHPIAEWKNAAGQTGVQWWIGQYATDTGVLCATFLDTKNNNYTTIASAPGVLVPNQFQHVALTYDGSTGRVGLYVNGVSVKTYNWGVFAPATQFDLWVGAHPDQCGFGCPGDGTCLGGLLDELALYNRALGSNEIAAIFRAGSGGKCEPLVAPYLVENSSAQYVSIGGTVLMYVLAGGTPPLSYQWTDNGSPIPGANSSTLVLSNVQLSAMGGYAVTITNQFGRTNTPAVMLQVLTVPIDPPFLTQQPTNQTVLAGQTATFSVAAGGTPPLAFQWLAGGLPLPHATNSTLVLTNLSTSLNGYILAAVVTNLFGAVTSAPAALAVYGCVGAPAGLVSWWPGQGGGLDVVGGNNGTLGPGTTLANGLVGPALAFSNTSAYVDIPASSSLDVGTNGSFTFEAWINPSDVAGVHSIATWATTNGSPGVQLGIGYTPWNSGVLWASVVDMGNVSPVSISSPPGTLVAGQYQHVALTFSATNGWLNLFVNGTNVATQPWGPYAPATVGDLWLGSGPVVGGNNISSDAVALDGTVEQVSLYNRALSGSELAAIYNAGPAGKCALLLAPFITTAPGNPTVRAGTTNTLSILAGGTPPLVYQWKYQGTNIPAATNRVLNLGKTHGRQKGAYQVSVTNSFGFTTATAQLVVAPAAYVWQTITSPQTAGLPFPVTVSALDDAGDLFTNFTGTVNLTTTNGLPVAPAASGTFVSGSWSGNVSLSAAANVVLVATDAANGTGQSNPFNVLSAPALTGSLTADGLQLQWSAALTGFVLEATTNLATGPWQSVDTETFNVGGLQQVTVPITATNQFFRLHCVGQ